MRFAVALAVWTILTLASAPSLAEGAASEGACSIVGDFHEASSDCFERASQTHKVLAAASDHTYSIEPVCDVGGMGTCSVTATCTVDGHDGTLFEVYQDGELLPWRSCMTDAEAERLGAITPALVTSAFKKLTWPTSRLIIQPPKGRTLVNFDTNVYTTNTQPTRQTVTLLGHQVTIEAAPTSYTWHFDPPDTGADPEADLTTDDPGAAYPDLNVTHRYQTKGTAHPSLDTIYTGRYRIEGRAQAGGWHPIPDTLTVAGPPQTLQILTATPHLVGP